MNNVIDLRTARVEIWSGVSKDEGESIVYDGGDESGARIAASAWCLPVIIRQGTGEARRESHPTIKGSRRK